jgi:hypothetical protein
MRDGVAMKITAKASDRMNFGALYLLGVVLVLWTGLGLVNRGLEMRLFKDYLLRWEVCLTEYDARQGVWPVFSGDNHTAYMDRLVAGMTHLGIAPPGSNTKTMYRYRIEKFGGADEKIFVLCLPDRMVIFGLSKQSLLHIERLVDQHVDLSSGRITGRPGKEPGTYIGQWRL